MAPVWQGQGCPQRAVMGFTGGLSQFRKQEGLGFCEHWGHLGLCSCCWHWHQGVCFWAFAPHSDWYLAKSHRFLGWESASSFTERKLNSHLLVHNCEKASQQQQQNLNSQTAFGRLRYLLYFLGFVSMVNYSSR